MFLGYSENRLLIEYIPLQQGLRPSHVLVAGKGHIAH